MLIVLLALCSALPYQWTAIDAVLDFARVGLAPTYNGSSLWDTHVQEAITKDVQPNCRPQKRLPNGLIQGLVVVFHGLTACPDGPSILTKQLQELGYMTLSPLMKGHGLKRNVYCQQEGMECVDGYPTGFLADSGDSFMDYVVWAQSMIKDELSRIPESQKSPTFKVSIVGHSIGAVVSHLVVSEPDTPVSNLLILNGVFGWGDASVDQKLQTCAALPEKEFVDCFQSTLGSLLSKFKSSNSTSLWTTLFHGIERVAEKVLLDAIAHFVYYHYHAALGITRESISYLSSLSILKPVLESPYLYNQPCHDQESVGRGGYCAIKIKNFLASHVLGLSAIQQASYVPPTVSIKYIASETDGPSRGYPVYNMASKMSNASMCGFYKTPNCTVSNTSNECGIPHSALSIPENMILSPNSLYWDSSLRSEIVSFLIGKKLDSSQVNPWKLDSIVASAAVPIIQSFVSFQGDSRVVCEPFILDGQWQRYSDFFNIGPL